MVTTTTRNYVRMMSFELAVPGNSQFNLSLPAGTDSIRVRGNSTANMNKRPYRLKFNSRQSLFGKERARSWVLIANYFDYTFALNAMAFSLGQRLGLEFTNSFQFVDVFVNNSYKGIYMLTEQVQVNPGRVDVDRDFGWLVEFDYHDPEPHHITFTTSGGNISMPARVRDPEVSSNFTISNPLVSFVQTQLNALFDAMSAPGFPNNGYRSQIDLESWAKYVLVQLLMDNYDFNNKTPAGAGMGGTSVFGQPGSNYAYKDVGQPIKAGPLWDFDLAGGVSPPSGFGMTNWPRHYVTTTEPIRPKHPFYQRLWDDPYFMAAFQRTWHRHQADFNAMPAFMDSIANVLAPRVQANFQAYTDGFQTGDTRPTDAQSYRAEVEKLKAWWRARMAFFGEELNKINVDTTLGRPPTASVLTRPNNNANAGNLRIVKNGVDLRADRGASVKIFRLDGREVRRENFAGGNHLIRLDGLPRGIYMVNAVIDGRESAVRVPVR
jgi:hypothetical protein